MSYREEGFDYFARTSSLVGDITVSASTPYLTSFF